MRHRAGTAALLMALVGCNGTPPDPPEETGETEVDVDDDLDGFFVPDDCDDGDASINPDASDIAGDGIDQDCDGVDAVNWATFSGTVQDTSGASLSGAVVNVCRNVCRILEIGPDGTFEVEVEPWTHSVHIEGPEDGSWASPLVPMTFAGDEERVLAAVVQSVPDRVDLPSAAAEIELPGGIFVTLAAGDIEILFSPDAITSVGSVLVEEGDRLPVELDGTVIAQWHLLPYNAKSDEGTPLRVRNDWSLPVGGTYEVWASDYNSFGWVSGGSLTVTADGAFLEGAAVVPEFTTLVLLDPA